MVPEYTLIWHICSTVSADNLLFFRRLETLSHMNAGSSPRFSLL
jgi:hypothetical protein